MYEAAFRPLVNSTQTYAPRTRCLLLFGLINTPYPFTHFTPILALTPLVPPGYENPPYMSVLYEICEFGASVVKVLEVSLQGGTARLPSSLIKSLCCSIIVMY